MTRRRTLALAGLLTLASALLAAPLTVAAQESPSASAGWWSRSPAQGAPTEGFAVASAPDGPVTVAAVVVAASGSVTSGTLRAVEVGGLGQQDAAVVVCPAASPVTLPPEGGGDLADAPEADCERGSAPFERDAESMQWTADLSSLAGELDGQVSLVIVPAPSESPVQPTFDVRLAAPEVDLVTVASDPVPDRSTPSPSPEPDPAPSPGRAPVTFDSGFSSGSPSPSPQPGFDPVDPVEAPTTPVAADVPEPADEEVEEETAMPVRPTAGISTGHGPQFGKAVAYVLVSALAGAVVTGAGRVAKRRQLHA